MCEFALNSTCSTSTGINPTYVVFSFEPTFPLEYAVRTVTDMQGFTPYNSMPCASHADNVDTYAVPTYRFWDGLWDYATM